MRNVIIGFVFIFLQRYSKILEQPNIKRNFAREMKQYKVIFIDWDDTIGDFQGSAQAAQREIFEKYNLAEFFSTYETYYDIYHEHNVTLWERYGRGEVSKEFLHRDRFLWPLCHVMGIPTPSQGPLVALADKMGEDFLQFTNKYFRLLPGTAELVQYLAGKYPLVVVSNSFFYSPEPLQSH